MSSRSLLLACIFATLFIVNNIAIGKAADDHVDDPDVLVLTKDNFDAIVNSAELIVVEFYAPWCGHCKHLAPEYAKAATALKKHDVMLAKVDATQESALAGRFSVSGYPTLKIFRNGKESPYNGPRQADGIINYMLKQVGPAAKPVTSPAELDKYIKNTEGPDNYWVAGFFKPGSPSALQSAFLLTVNKLRDDHTFLKVVSEDMLKAYNIENEAIVVFKLFDDKQTTYVGDTKPSNVEKFVLRNSLPLVGNYDSKTSSRYYKRGLPVAKLYVDVALTEANEKHTKYFYNRLKTLAEEFRDEMIFCLANSKEQSKELSEVNGASVPNIFVIENSEGKKYVHKEKFSGDSVRKFVEGYRKGSIEAYVKSEEEPADNSGPVKVITGKTFQKIVNDPTKDVLIEFYAPWCGHCKQLTPIYEKVGKSFAAYDSVVVAKIDATANDYPSDFPVSGYPTIFMVPAKANATPIKYDGDRDQSALENFIKKHAVKPLKKAKKTKKAKSK